MANADHLERLRQGVDAWNAWREKARVRIHFGGDLRAADLNVANLSGANLSGANLSKADLSEANLSQADLSRAILYEADLSGAKLSKADLSEAELARANLTEADLRGADLSAANLAGANLIEANLSGADLSRAYLREAVLLRAVLSGANLSGANLSGVYLRGVVLSRAVLSGANLSEADLGGADLREAVLSGALLNSAVLSGANLSGANLGGANLVVASLVETDLTNANLTGCHIYGISAWDLKLSPDTKQQNLVITKDKEPEITVDDIEVAQFVYLLLHNEKIRRVVDTITSKAVLILGRFTSERKAVLDALRDKLRRCNYLPILFDFDPSASRDVTETVKVLAGLARFIIADITDSTEVRVELHNIVPDFTKLPVQPILLRGYGEFFSLPRHLMSYPWVLPTFEYDSREELIARLDEVIRPAEAKVLELREAKH